MEGRAKPLAPLPPPLTEAGAIGWLRKNLFSGWLNIALTIVCALLIVWIVPPLVKFLLIDAVWDGSSRADCLPGPDRPEVGACWAFVIDRINFFTYGFYPIAERWRVDVFFALLAVGVVWMAWLDAPRRDLGVIYFFVVMPIASLILLLGWPLIGLPKVATTSWGGVLVTVVVASVGIVFSLPIGIVLALGRRSRMPAVRLFSVIFIEFVRGVPLITVLFMASVMLPLFVPDTWSPDKLLRALVGVSLFASAYMAEVVRAGLQAIPKGQYEAAIRGRPELLEDHAARHPAAGAEDHHPEHRQHHHRPVQGHHARVHRRHLRFPDDHRGGARRSDLGDAGDQHHRLCLRRDLLPGLLLRHVALCALRRGPPRGGRQALRGLEWHRKTHSSPRR